MSRFIACSSSRCDLVRPVARRCAMTIWVQRFLLFPLLLLSVSSQATAIDHLQNKIQQDCKVIEDMIIGENLSKALVLGGSSLYHWRFHPGHQDIAKTLVRSYKGLPPNKAVALFRFRKGIKATEYNPLGWLDVGLLAQSLSRHRDAVFAFKKAAEDPECCRVPTTFCLLGKAYLDIGEVTKALENCGRAIRSASLTSSILFRTRYEVVEPLLGSGYFEQAFPLSQPCLRSEIPLERAWIQSRLFLHSWLGKDLATASTSIETMQTDLESESSYAFGSWERGLYEEISSLIGFATPSMNGSSLDTLAVDVLASEMQFASGNPEKVIESLQKWIEIYSLDDIGNLDAPYQGFALQAHDRYFGAIGLSGNPQTAAQFYERLLEHPIWGASPDYQVIAHCSRGYWKWKSGEIEEALLAYEEGLAIDTGPKTIQKSDPLNRAYIQDGIVEPGLREKYVAGYQHVQEIIQRKGFVR